MFRFTACPKQARFILYSFGANVCSGFENTLGMSALFTAMNVDSTQGLVSSYAGRDIVSNLSSLCFIYRLSTGIDGKLKKSFKYSQACYQGALFIDLSAPWIPEQLLVALTGVGGMGKTIAWITIGSLNAKMVQQLAPDNMAELYSKVAIVNTLGNSLGMLLGLTFMKYNPDGLLVPSTIGICGGLRYYCYYTALKNVFNHN
jgi:hypothetical protein